MSWIPFVPEMRTGVPARTGTYRRTGVPAYRRTEKISRQDGSEPDVPAL